MDRKGLIGLRIKELRKKRGFAQEEVASLANITAKHISSIELGKENPTVDTLLKLADVYKVELWELLNYAHELKRKDLQERLRHLIKTLKDDELRLIVKFIDTLTK
jgi:transcriptional regulator with XRE-family HTH domain